MIFRRIILALSCALLLFTIGLWRLSDGFSLAKMREQLSNDPRFEVAAPSTFQVRSILAQPYRYIGKGSQSYVFESEDGEYVLKFFRLSRYRLPSLQRRLILPPFLAEIQNGRIEERNKKRDRHFASCKLAYEELRDETALVYLHLNPTRYLNQSVKLYDNLGRPHTVAIDEEIFLIQRKGELLYSHLGRLIKARDHEGFREALRSLGGLLNRRLEHGIADNDAEIHKNAGFRNGKALFLDVGQFSRSGGAENRERVTRKLIAWLEQKDPDLAREAKELLKAPVAHVPDRPSS